VNDGDAGTDQLGKDSAHGRVVPVVFHHNFRPARRLDLILHVHPRHAFGGGQSGLRFFDPAQQRDVDAPVRHQAALHLFQFAHGHQRSGFDNAHVSANLGHVGQDMRGEEDRLAHPREFHEQFTDLNAGAWVEAGGRFVENEDLRVVRKRSRQRQPLLHAAREALHPVISTVREVYQFQQIFVDRRALGFGNLVTRAKEVEVLPHGHIVVHAEEVGHVTDGPADAARVFRHRVPGHVGLAARGRHERGKDAHGCRLARAVGADEAEDRPGFYSQRQVMHGRQLAVGLFQVADLDDWGHMKRRVTASRDRVA
jgi:hypothetical protein